MTPLPMTTISGYLGAGKTTFLNSLLAEPKGVRYGVLVNDFGAIAIDEGLVKNQTGDVIALSNGCVCCSIDGDLYSALDRILTATDCPDHLVLEASGVADPAKLAQIAEAEPDLQNAGVLTLVDCMNIDGLLADPQLRDSVLRQISYADKIALSKTDLAGEDKAIAVTEALAQHSRMGSITIMGACHPSKLLPTVARSKTVRPNGHAHYATWSYRGQAALPLDLWREVVTSGNDILRMKGYLKTEGGERYLVQLAGQQWEETPADQGPTELVVIGLEDRLDTARLDAALA